MFSKFFYSKFTVLKFFFLKKTNHPTLYFLLFLNLTHKFFLIFKFQLEKKIKSSIFYAVFYLSIID